MLPAARIVAAFLAALPLLACAERIVIGQSAPLTGANADIGKEIRDGVLAYFRKVNAAGRSSSFRSTTRTTASGRAPTP